MEPSCIRQTLLPGTTKLFGDYLYEYNRVAQFYSGYFGDAEAVMKAARKLEYPADRRARLVEVLREQNGSSPALDKLAEPDTVAVVTGQQVGLFSGPAYTVFKALTAVTLARELTEQGIPAVPVFWLATEDHDLEEVNHVWTFNQDATPSLLKVPDGANVGPVGDVPLEDVPIRELRDSLGELPYASDVVKKLEESYRPGASFGSAFHQFLKEILHQFGLLYFDPLSPKVRALAIPFMQNVVAHVDELGRALRERNKELIAAGYHAQVMVEADASLLFLLSEGKRVPLRWKDGRFVAKDQSFTPGELRDMAHRLSPNALLRPVMQDFLIPNVSYVAGPAEIAYLAQSEVLYRRLLGRMPMVVPRKSFTLLDARADKILKRYGIPFVDILDYQERVRGRLAAKLVPDKLAGHFISLKSTVSASLSQLQSSLTEFDPTLQAAAQKSGAKILYQIEKLSQKTARETMRRDKRAERDAGYLSNLTYPRRHLQERLYSIVPFLAQHGLDLPQRLLQLTQMDCPDHMVRTL